MTAPDIIEEIYRRSGYFADTLAKGRANADDEAMRYGGVRYVVKDRDEFVSVNRERLDREYPGAKILYSSDQDRP